MNAEPPASVPRQSEAKVGERVPTALERALSFLLGVLERSEASIVFVLVVLSLIFSLFSPAFLTLGNFLNIFRNYADIAISALGMTLVILAGGIDLSVGSTMALAGLASAMAVGLGERGLGLPTPVAVLAGVGVGGLAGLANGVLIVHLRIQPFIATLGMLGVLRGIVVGTTSGQTVRGFPESFTWLGQGYIGPIPMPALIMLFLAAVVALFLRYHVWGTYVYSIGGNETSATLTGLPVNQVKMFVYTMSGLLSGVAGILVVARLGVSAPTQALGYELFVIAATVIGGVSLMGGRGSVLGAVLGAVLIGVLNNALVFLRVESYWQNAFTGGIILLSALVDRLRLRRA
jgi:ribose transport system permease protein